jgi:triosephosphate isomerase (TIM)
MTRKFFVGGNFKMNPSTKEAKVALIKLLNEAELSSETGQSLEPK